MNRAVSIRRRLITRLLAGALLITLASALGLYLYLRGELIEQYDGALVAKARALAEILSEEHEHFFGQGGIDPPRAVPRLTLHRDDNYQIWSVGGAVAGRSSSLEGHDLPRIGRMRRGRTVSVVYEVPLPAGRRGRAVEALIDPRTAADYAAAEAGQASPSPPSLVIATDVDEMEETLRHLAWVLLAMALGVTLGATALVVLIVNDGTRAVRRLSADVARVDADTLQARIDAASLPRELQPIARRLNRLLDRLDAVLSRERRFTANVAHELRIGGAAGDDGSRSALAAGGPGCPRCRVCPTVAGDRADVISGVRVVHAGAPAGGTAADGAYELQPRRRSGKGLAAVCRQGPAAGAGV